MVSGHAQDHFNQAGDRLRKAYLIVLLAIFFTFLTVPQTVQAKGLTCEKLILGGSYSLASDEVLPGNLCLLAGVGTLEAGSIIEGDVFLLGGNLQANGSVSGNMTVAGGLVDFSETTAVEGDLRVIGGQVFGLELAEVKGEVIHNLNLPSAFQMPVIGWGNPSGFIQPLWRLFWLPMRSIIWVGFALLIYLLIPKRVDVSGQAAKTQPALSGVIGLGTVLVSLIASVLLAVTIICSPLSLLLLVALLAAWGVGIVALGNVFGAYLAKLLNQDWAPMLQLGVGVFTLTFIINIPGLFVSCLGFLLSFLAGIIGLGAVVLTRFGDQPYPQASLK